MKLLAFSDLHLDTDAADRIVAEATKADLVIGAGDFAQARTGLEAFMARLAPIAEKAIYVAGNNESRDELRHATEATVLHGTSITWQGLVVAGIGGATPPLPPIPWDSWDLTEAQVETLLSGLPRADILISHSPPHGVADRHGRRGHIGSHAVRDAAIRLAPRLLFCGHIHDAWGETGMVHTTRVHNLGPTPNWFEVPA